MWVAQGHLEASASDITNSVQTQTLRVKCAPYLPGILISKPLWPAILMLLRTSMVALNLVYLLQTHRGAETSLN